MIRNSAAHSGILLAVVLYTAGTAWAADTGGKQSTEQRQIQALQQQLAAVEMQVKRLGDQNQALLEKQRQLEGQMTQQSVALQPTMPSPSTQTPANAVVPGPTTFNAAPVAATAFANVRLWGYGELYYSRPSRAPSKAQADLARAVFGIGYAFDSRTEFNSEFEVEHAVASAADAGEFEVEQFYVDRQLNQALTLRAGLFLMPFGLLNEHHEPTNFYGVQRNFVETLIIPSTWREGGFNVHGDTESGINWNAGITTGFDLSKWDFTPKFPLYSTALDLENSGAAPLRSTHQELALANAHNLSQYLALGYYGVPGLSVGAALSTGKAVSVAAPANAPLLGDSRVTLWEAHARWTPAKFDLSALYAHGSISNLAATNASNPGSPNPIPSNFYGYYAQAAYGLWEHDEYRLAPFVRWERYDMGSRYAGTPGPAIPTGLVPLSGTPGDYGYWPRTQDRVWSLGANFYVTPHLVFKADYQWFDLNGDFNRFDVGLGLNY
ncbi:MAG: OprO/OprP family phosphate-selective porin [Pseudomonadota bacterium]|nr:OprO/OprP family phosphate-selective porin [Pseudomonadota bacterium]